MAGTWLSAQTTLAGCGAHDPSLGGRSRGLRGDPVAGHGVAAKPGKVMRVTVASNYRMRDENGQWKEDPHWNEITVFNKARQGLARATSRSTSRRATWFMCAAASGRTATSAPTAAWPTRWT